MKGKLLHGQCRISRCVKAPFPFTILCFKNLPFVPQVHEGSQVLLSACLACDGCVSEEENLKISQQSLEQVERVLALNKVRGRASRGKAAPVSSFIERYLFF